MELQVDQLRLNDRNNRDKISSFEKQVEHLEWLVLQLMNQNKVEDSTAESL